MKLKNSKFFVLIPVALAIIVFHQVFLCEFTHFDDHLQVTENNDIKAITFQNIGHIFSSFYVGMYQPLTMLTYAIEYYFFGLNPAAFHGFNLLFHLLNIVFVFIFLGLLLKRQWVAFIITCLFAINPLQAEPIAWVSARSTMLFTLFYLIAMIYYLKYVRQNNYTFYYLVILFFIFSLLSKVFAVSFPFALLLIDFFEKRKITKKLILEKLPFFIISFIFGIIVIIAREEAGHILNIPDYSFIDKIIIIVFQLVIYPFKLLFPVNLSMFYPYPDKIGGWLPLVFYLTFTLFVILIIGLVVFRKKIFESSLFGILFFIVNIAFVLKFIFLSNFLLADRYMYLASLGIYIGLIFPFETINPGKKILLLLQTTFVIYILFLSFLSFNRVQVWKTDLTLFTDFITKYPAEEFAWYSRGVSRNRIKDYKNAIVDFDNAIRLDSTYVNAYYNRAEAYYNLKKFDLAIVDFNKVLTLSQDSVQISNIYDYFGIINGQNNNFRAAFSFFDMSLEIIPNFEEALFNRGHLYFLTGNFEKAMADYKTLLKINPENQRAGEGIAKIERLFADPAESSKLLMNKGIEYAQKSQFKEALNFLNQSIQFDSTNFAAFQNRALIYYQSGNIQQARNDINFIISKGGVVDKYIIKELF